jgi:DNA-binding SARP family transcriptional activator
VAAQAGHASVRAEPLRESALAALVDAHLAAGNRYEAVCEYRAYAARLQIELGLDPGFDLSERVSGITR